MLFWRRISNGPFRSVCRFYTDSKKIIIISGVTAVGKSAIAVELAKQIDGEIINGDSMQVYKNMRIGTNIIPESERQGVPHHLLEFIDPLVDNSSAGIFYEKALQTVKEVTSRNKIPIVVGGSVFYLKWLHYGRPSEKYKSDELESSFYEQIERDGNWDLSLNRLARLDPDYAAKINRNDVYRLVRSLTKCTIAGKKMKEIEEEISDEERHYFDARAFYLTRPKPVIRKYVDVRTTQLLLNGFIEEAGDLVRRGLTTKHNATAAIGYREIMEVITDSNPITISVVNNLIQSVEQASKKLVSVQIKYARSPSFNFFRWIDLHQIEERPPTDELLTNVNENSQKLIDAILFGYNLTQEQWGNPRYRELYSPSEEYKRKEEKGFSGKVKQFVAEPLHTKNLELIKERLIKQQKAYFSSRVAIK